MSILNKNKRRVLLSCLVVLILLLGTTYAFFTYERTSTAESQLIAGEIYLHLNDDGNSLVLNNAYPETDEHARSRDDNYITFTIDGKNTTTNRDIWYEIDLVEGSLETGKSRFNPTDIKFDLVETIDGVDNLVVDAQTFSDFNSTRIWVNTVNHDTTSEILRTYTLRMWISGDVTVSNQNGANYTPGEFRNKMASVKVKVIGDFTEKLRFDLQADAIYTIGDTSTSRTTPINLVNLTDANATFSYSVDGGAYQSFTGTTISPNLTSGTHTVSVKGVDATGTNVIRSVTFDVSYLAILHKLDSSEEYFEVVRTKEYDYLDSLPTMYNGNHIIWTYNNNTVDGATIVTPTSRHTLTMALDPNYIDPSTLTTYCRSVTYNATSQLLTNALAHVTFSDNYATTVGTYTIRATLASGYKWTDETTIVREFTCDLDPGIIDNNTTVSGLVNKVYTGQPHEQLPVVVVDGRTLIPDVDFQYETTNNINVGTAFVTITGINNYEGTTTRTFQITPAACVIDCTDPTPVYDTTTLTIATTADGTLSNHQQSSAGSHTVSCTGDSNHSNTTQSCSIEKRDDVVTLTAKTNMKYTGSAQAANTATTLSGVTATYKYYSSLANCQNDASGTTTAPTNVGNYYVKAFSAGNANHNAAESGCVTHNISKADLEIVCTNNYYVDDNTNVTIANCYKAGTQTAAGTISSNASGHVVGEYEITCSGGTNYNDAAKKTCKLADPNAPIADITSTATLKSTSQTLTLKCTGTSSKKIKYYYFGTTAPSSDTTYTSITAATTYTTTQSVTANGTYYLACKNSAGTVDTDKIVIRYYTVRNYLNNITGSTHTSADYTQTYAKKYYIPSGTVLTLSSIYTVPTGSNANKYEGYSLGSISDTEATPLSGTTYTLTANKTIAMWFTRNLVHIRYRVNSGTLTTPTYTSGGTRYDWTTSSAGTVYRAVNQGTAAFLETKLRYGASSLDLANYNNSKNLYISRDGYTVPSGQQWKCTTGCTDTSVTFSQSAITLSTPSGGNVPTDTICDASADDCIANIKVNWKAIATTGTCNSYTYNGSSRQLISNGTGVTYTNNYRTKAGSQTVTINVSSGYIFSDGTSSKTLSCSIGKKSLTVTAKSKTCEYSGSACSVTGCTASGLASGDSITCSNTTSRTSLGSSTSSVSSSQVTISGNGDTSCYNISYVNGTVKVQDTTSPTCSLSLATSGKVTATYGDAHGVSAKGFSTSYDGATSKTYSSTATAKYYVKDSTGNTGNCSIKVQWQKKTQSCSVGKACEAAGCKTSNTTYSCLSGWYGPYTDSLGHYCLSAKQSICGDGYTNCSLMEAIETTTCLEYNTSASACGCQTWASASWVNATSCTASTTNTTKITCQAVQG